MQIPFSHDQNAAAIYHLLQDSFVQKVQPVLERFKEFTGPGFTAHTLLNGQERGIAVTVDNLTLQDGDTLVVKFGTVRGSDSLFVEQCGTQQFNVAFTGPSQQHFNEGSYRNRKTFPHDAHGSAADLVAEHLAAFLEKILNARVERGEA